MMQAEDHVFNEEWFLDGRNYPLPPFGSSINLCGITTGLATRNTGRNGAHLWNPLGSTGVRKW